MSILSVYTYSFQNEKNGVIKYLKKGCLKFFFIITKFNENHKLTNPSSSRKPKQKKHEEAALRYIIVTVLSIGSKENTLKSARE